MPAQRSHLRLNPLRICLFFCIVIFLAACQSAGVPLTTPTAAPTVSNIPPASTMAEVTFEAQLPAKLADGQSLYIEFLDEVTGLALNPARAKMQTSDGLYYGIKIPVAVGSVIKYRYFRDNDPAGIEYNPHNQPVRYRMYIVDGPGTVRDTIAGWKSKLVDTKLGRIQGQIANKNNNSPVVNALVVAGGMQTLTSSDGSFILEGLAPGTHNLVVYSLDGSFQPFQQGATVAADSTTPALVMLLPSSPVNITFLVKPPADNPSGVPIRLLGNIYPLGNTFADLQGGMNVVASRAPLLSTLPDGRYSIRVRLPVGLDLRYKYSLGDGFWNAERGSNGATRVRQLIVPNKDTTIEDEIGTWQTLGFAPVSFSVNVPENTPSTDTVSIQFNPFGWTQPIPMWQSGKNQWSYTLYNPLDLISTTRYRYCRNDQCGIAESADNQGAAGKEKSFSPQADAQDIKDTVNAWAWFDTSAEPVVVPGSKINVRGKTFQAGAEFVTGYNPSWQPYQPAAFQNLKDIGANTVMLTPSWHLINQDPPVMAPVAGYDPLWFDLSQTVQQAQQKGLDVILHPVVRYPGDPQVWWQDAVRDDNWWQSWFDRYRTFLIYHADLATQSGVKTLVIGDETLLPAWPNGTLADGSSSRVPADANQRWKSLISALRARYTGKLVWMIPYSPGKLPATPDFLTDVDLLYVQLSAPLTPSDQPNMPDLATSITTALDTDILKLQEQTNHPVLLGLQYPSIQGAFDGCIEVDGACLAAGALQQPAPKYPEAMLALKDQADVYSAVLSAVNDRAWIAGFFASGYYPPVALKDLSISVRNKPASDVLWYWYPRLLGQVAP